MEPQEPKMVEANQDENREKVRVAFESLSSAVQELRRIDFSLLKAEELINLEQKLKEAQASVTAVATEFKK